MSKYANAWRAVYNGFMPVSQIKLTFVTIIVLYFFFLSYDIKGDFSTKRNVKIEQETKGGNVVVGGVKHLVPYTTVSTMVNFDIDNPTDFLLLSSGELGDSLVTALLKAATCVLALIVLWSFDFSDPFNIRSYKQLKIIGWLCILILLVDYYKDLYSSQWINNLNHGVLGFKYSRSVNLFYFIAYLWILRAVIAFYKAGVKTQQEAQLTI